MVEQVPETRVLGTRSTMEKWVEGMTEQGFSSVFAQILAIFVAFSKWSALKVLWNF